MSSIIKPKRSNTAAAVPTTGDLADGELAANTADKKLYIRVGAAIVDMSPSGGGGGGGLAWSTVNANTSMTAGNGYVVEGARDMTLPATVPAGAEFVVYAATAAVRIVSNGNVIAGVGSGNDLTIAMNETAHLVGRSSGNLEIV